jgi:predicted aspartyl protease
VALCLLSPTAKADIQVPILPHQELGTFYVQVAVAGALPEAYLVDTGAGFMTITDETLNRSRLAGTATYMRELSGQLADGTVLQVPVYRLDEIIVGEHCSLRDVEAAVLPGASRGLLGLSALRKAAPFEFSTTPPSLRLSNCDLAPRN